MRPIIGKFYMVPCVFMNVWGNQWIPVHGPNHEDKEVIGFEPHHWHIDWRFAPTRWFNNLVEIYGSRISSGSGIDGLQGKVVCSPDRDGFIRTVDMRRKKCHREMPIFPIKAPWIKRLEEKFKGQRLNCLRCPHRGISLEGMPVREGFVICPGHGLMFDAATGIQVNRTNG